MDLSAVHYPAVFVAALAAFTIGFLWHGPVFGAVWIRLMKMTPEQIEQGRKEMTSKMPLYMLAAFVQQLVLAWVVALFCAWIGIADAVSACLLAFWLWLGLIATTLLNGVLWEKRSMSLYLFGLAYHLVSLVVIALIVGVWK